MSKQNNNTNQKPKQQVRTIVNTIVKRRNANATRGRRRTGNANRGTQNRQPNLKRLVNRYKSNNRVFNIGRAGSLMNNNYAMCRLTPFKSRSATTGIPDGVTARRILIDHRMQNTFTFGSTGSVYIAITPAIPSSIWYNTPEVDTEFRINGKQILYHKMPTMNAIMQPEWRGLSVDLNNTEGKFDDAFSLYGSNKCRIVTVGWQITYVGSTMANSGYVNVNSCQVSAGAESGNLGTFYVYNRDATSDKTWNQGQVMVRRFNGGLGFVNANSVESKFFQLYKGCHGVLRHSESDYITKPLSSALTFISDPTDENYSLLTHDNSGTEGEMAHWPQVSAFDDGWSSTLLSISGGTTGQSFVLDTLYCVEYYPTMHSDVFALAKSGPPNNEKLVENVSRVAAKMPVANEGSSLSNIISHVAPVISTVAPLLM